MKHKILHLVVTYVWPTVFLLKIIDNVIGNTDRIVPALIK